MSEIIFGTPEHVAGLSRKALEEDFQWVNDRRMELEGECERLDAENAKLREQMERLVTLLRVDCDIDASWDGLRRFWNIGLTEDGCLMRDRACKAEAENAKLRELVDELYPLADYGAMDASELDRAHDLMRELGLEVG